MSSGSSARSISLVVLAALAVYALVFVALSVDLMVRVWQLRFSFDSPVDVVVLLYFESVRSVLTLAGISIAVLAAFRARQQPALGHFAVAVAFATVAYTKAMGFAAFPGAMQEALAVSLRERAVPEWLLLTVFAQPLWAVWLAVPALLLFAASYPRRISRADVMGTESGERQGTMRNVAVAGTDVGTVARGFTIRLIEGGQLSPAPLWGVAIAGAFLHTAALLNAGPGGRMVANVAALIVFALAAAVCITLLRAGTERAGTAEQAPLVWLQRGSAGSLALFGLAAVAAATLPTGGISTGAFSLAPAAMAAGLFMAVVTVPGGQAGTDSAQPDDGELMIIPQHEVERLQ